MSYEIFGRIAFQVEETAGTKMTLSLEQRKQEESVRKESQRGEGEQAN